MMAGNKRHSTKITAQEKRAAYLFLIPAFVGLTFLTYGPLVAVLVLSFFNFGGMVLRPSFVGFLNYIRLFTEDPYFIDSIKVTAYFALLSVAGCLVYSLGVAMLLNRKIPARGFFRAAFYLPYVLPSVAVCIGWSWLYHGNFGLFNYVLSIFGIQKVMFIADSSLVVPSLAIM
jgi:multiple sugar transport system permease protein